MRFMLTQPEENRPHYLRGYAKEGNDEWVTRLIKDGVDVNAKDEHGMTALHLACAANKVKTVEILLDHDASLSMPNLHGQTPLHLLAANGHLDLLKSLMDGVDKETIDRKANKSGHTALHYASRNGHAEICRLLLQFGATKAIPDAVRIPPVKYAKNDETRKVFQEPAPTDPRISTAPKAESPKPVKIPEPSKPSRPDPKPVKEPARGRSKSTDPPRARRSKDPSTQRQEKSLENRRSSIDASTKDYGRGQINRNDVSIFSDSTAREKEEVGPVTVDKKAELEVKQVKDKKMTFSDAHKKRMQMSVFDRLAGGSKKK